MAWAILLGAICFLLFAWSRSGGRKGNKLSDSHDRQYVSSHSMSEDPEAKLSRHRTLSRNRLSPAKATLSRSDDERDFDIEYADADGVVSTRRIKVIDLEGSAGALYLRSMCSLRQAERTFRADRILSARSAITGERIGDPVVHFRSQYSAIHEKDPDHEAVMGRVRGGLNILIWIAMADREISSDEQELLLEFIATRNALAGPKYASVAWRRARATRYIDEARPTFSIAAGYLAGISKTGREWRMLAEFAARIAAMGGAGGENRRKQLFG